METREPSPDDVQNTVMGDSPEPAGQEPVEGKPKRGRGRPTGVRAEDLGQGKDVAKEHVVEESKRRGRQTKRTTGAESDGGSVEINEAEPVR